MRIFTRKTHQGLPDQPLPLSSQTFCETEDVINLMQAHVAANGMVDTLYIEFENMKIPICHKSELRIAAQLAAAYNNSIIQENLQCQRDLYYKSYTQTPFLNELNFNDDLLTHLHEPPSTSKDSEKKMWDEEISGEQVVYDAEFEQNEELSQSVFKNARAQKFGEHGVF